MKRPETAIKNLIDSHLRRSLFGMEIYGRHELHVFDGRQEQIGIIEVAGAGRFNNRYGQVVLYHPWHGKWIATLLSEHHAGKPVQALTAEEIRSNIARTPSQDFIYKVYGGEPPVTAPVSWDPYWETT